MPLTVLYPERLLLSAGQPGASYQGTAAGPGLCHTGVSSLFTAIIWMLQRPLSGYGGDFIDPPFRWNINCLSMIQYESTKGSWEL